MNIKKYLSIFVVISLAIILNGCANSTFQKKYNKPFKHNSPLIKDDIRKAGKSEIAKTLEMGPKPIEGDTRKLGKRKKNIITKTKKLFNYSWSVSKIKTKNHFKVSKPRF